MLFKLYGILGFGDDDAQAVDRSAVRSEPSSSDHVRMTSKRRYRFVITVDVDPGHAAYDDPEWAADAAWGALTNEYGLRSIYTDIEEVLPAMDE